MTHKDLNDKHYLKEELYERVKTDRAIFDFIQQGSLDGIWYWDLEDQENEWMSPRFWELLGWAPSEKKHNPSEWQDMINPDDLKLALENFEKHLEDSAHPYDQIVRYSHKDGHTVWVRCRGMAIRDDSGKPIRMLGAHNDITVQKQKESDLQNLLTEMNHRVKNNLAMISSLINIKGMMLENEECKSVLSEIQQHIDAISLLHANLYQNQGFSKINFKEYCNELLDNTFSNYIHGNVRVENNAAPYLLNTARTTTLGLIVNEVATNAMKHGFSSDTEAVFSVEFTKPGDNT
ncbi:MAG TPA: hypothetical protein DCO79_02750, partial [Spirochaeta sp.]|nr:hypothetical protein [Spirochaeta sp.]